MKEWRNTLERDLFGIREPGKTLSGRILLGFYMRRTEKTVSPMLSNPTHPPTSRHLATANLCYLLGMDWSLAARYGELSEREQTRRKLAQATSDPVWKDIVGKSGDLRGQLIVIERHIADLKAQISDFQVVPEYEEIRQEAERVNARIRGLREADVIGRRNLADIERSIEEAGDPGHD